jgi:hypothetical protein
MKNLITLLLLLMATAAIGQRPTLLVELFSFEGSQTQPYVDIISNTDGIVFIHWKKGEEESTFRTKRRLESRFVDDNTQISLEGHFKLDKDSLPIELPLYLDSLKYEIYPLGVGLRYDKARGKIVATIYNQDGGDFWFVSKQKGSDEPFFVKNEIIEDQPGPVMYVFEYEMLSQNRETEFVIWLQGITITRIMRRIITPIHFWE